MSSAVDRGDVVVERAGPERAVVLANLLELYLHDRSETFPRIELGSDGRFGYEFLPSYWSEPDRRFPFFIKHGAQIAGFVLITRGSPASDDPEALDVAEFFVLRKYRRSGVGRRAAFAVWNDLRGRWIVRVSAGNTSALPFWTATVMEYSRGTATQFTRPGEPRDWRVFSFSSR